MDRAPGTAPTRAHLVLVGSEPDPQGTPTADRRAGSPVPGLARLVRPGLAQSLPGAPRSTGRSLGEVLDRVRRDAAADPAGWLAELGDARGPGPRR